MRGQNIQTKSYASGKEVDLRKNFSNCLKIARFQVPTVRLNPA